MLFFYNITEDKIPILRNTSGINMTIGKKYYISGSYSSYLTTVNDYKYEDDFNKPLSIIYFGGSRYLVSRSNFVTLEEWRDKQINSIMC